MTTRRPDTTAAPPKDQAESAAPNLLTSEDLFGDMVDGPPAPSARPVAAPPASRKGPIKVQVSEPGAPRKDSPLSSPAAPGEKLPEDVAALLDAFSEPAEAALREEMYSEAPGIEELIDEGSAALGSEEPPAPAPPSRGAPPKPEDPPPAAVAPPTKAPPVRPADEDQELLLNVLPPPEARPKNDPLRAPSAAAHDSQ